MKDINTKSSNLPATGYTRLSRLVPDIVPVSTSTFWRMVKRKEFPAPHRLSKRITAWKNEDVIAWIKAQTATKV